jgi:glyoxylase-like metal-dependent hydrolase (beta-lactamase superfamily II)
MNYYQWEKMAPNVTKITDFAGVSSFLVEGKVRAALLDTCNGVGNLRSLVESLTRLPLTVICTHGHVDHAGGTYDFDNVCLSEKDYELAKRHTTIKMRKDYFATMLPPGTIPDEDYRPQRLGDYQDLLDGQFFDLGGSTLEAIALPGHTPGMTCILIKELRAVLLGDACNSATFLFSEEASSVEQYKHNLEDFLCHEGKYDTVWFSHGHNKGPKSIVHEGIELCDGIMAGNTENLPFEFMGETACLAKAINPDYSRVDGKTFNIVFNPNKVFAE